MTRYTNILLFIYFILQVCHCNRSINSTMFTNDWNFHTEIVLHPHRDSSPITGFQKRTTYGISNYFKIKANNN
jgi:hypothetical protein